MILLAVVLLAGCRSSASRKRAYMEEGRRYEREGKPREAAIEFANAVRLEPDDPNAHLALARADRHSGATQLAIYELGKALELQPENTDARVSVGELLLKTGQVEAALTQARWVVYKQPNNAAAQKLLASAAGALGSRDEALKAARAAVALAPQQSEYHTVLAQLLVFDSKARDEAVKELQQAIRLDPKNVAARNTMAQLLERTGDVHGAEEQLQQAIHLAPQSVEARTSLAALYLRTGDASRAEETLRSATDDLSDTPQAAPLLEGFYQQTGHMDRARATYEALVNRHPNSLSLQVAYLRVLMDEGDFNSARPRLDKLVQDHGSDPDVTLLQSYALMHDGKNSAAVELLKTASQSYPDRTDLLVLLGEAQEGTGDMQDALSTLRRAARMDGSNLQAQNALAEFGYRNANTAIMNEAAAQMLLRHPEDADGYLWRGIARLQEKQGESAVADLKEAVLRRPNDPFATVELGRAMEAAGAKDKARSYFEQVLQVSPDAEAASALSNLLVRDGHAADAVKMLQQQTVRASHSAELYVVLAQAQMAAGDTNGALASSSKAMQLAPADRGALQVFTEAALDSGNLNAPMDHWTRWTEEHPNDPHGPAALGMLFEAAGDSKSAIEYYRRSLSLQGGQPELSAAVATLTADSGGNLDVALSMAQTAYQQAPDSAQTADAVGWINYRKGLPASALAPLRNAVSLDASNAAVLYHLGVVEAALGDRNNAVAHLQKAGTLAAGTKISSDIQNALAKLQLKGAS